MYHLQVLTPEQAVFDGEITSLIAPGKEGYLGVLTDHASLITCLKSGGLIITGKDNQKSYFKVSTGILEVNKNRASILVKTAEPTDFIDIGTGGGI